MADNISNIIGGDVHPALDKLIARLVNVEEEIASINSKPLTIKVDMQGLDSITQLNDMLKRQELAIKEVQKTVENYKEATAQLNAVQAVHGQNVTDNVKQLTQQKLELGYVSEQLKILNKDIQAGNGNIDQNNAKLEMWTKRQQELKVELSATQQALKSQIKDTYAAVGSMDEMSLKLGQLREKFRALSAEQREGTFGKQLQRDIFALDKGIKELDATIGNSQRNVGNYGSAFDRLGAAADKLGTFITRDLFRSLASGLVFGVAASGLQLLIDAFTKARKEAEELKNKMTEIENQAQAEAYKEIASTNLLLDIAKNQNETMTVRLRAVDELQKRYPDYLGNLSKEAILTGNTADAVKRLNENLLAKAAMQASIDKISELGKQYAELKGKERDLIINQSKDLEKAGNADPKGRSAIVSYYTVERAKVEKEIKKIEDLNAQYAQDAKNFAEQAGDLAVARPSERKKKAEREDRSADDLAKAIYEQRKAELEADMKVQKEIGDNTQVSLQIRLDSYRRYYNDVERLAFAEGERDIQLEKNKRERLEKELKSGKIKSPEFNTEIEASKKREQAIIEKYGSAILAANTNLSNANEKIYQDEVDKRNKIIKGAAENNKTAMDEELLALSERYAQGLIKEEDYQQQKKAIQDKYATSYLNDVVAYLQQDIANSNLSNEAKKKLIDELTDYERKALEQQIKNNEDAAKKKTDIKDKEKDLSIRLIEETMKSITTIVDNQFDAERKQLDIKLQKIQQSAERQKQAVQATTNFQISKDNQIAKINAQTAAAEDEIRKKQQAEEIKKAKFDKAAAEASIVLNTAVAISKILANKAYNPIEAGILIALTTAIGAAQYAAAASTPIPQYQFGTPEGGTHTPLFIAGDGGERELIAPPNKAPYWSSDSSTVYKEALGTHVIPMDKLINYATANVTAIPAFGLQAVESKHKEDMMIRTMTNVLAGKLDNLNEDIVTAIVRSRPIIPKDTAIADALRQNSNLKMK